MITASTYPTTLPKTSRGSGHFHISDPYKYCRELDLVIQVAKSKGYQLPTDYQLRMLNFYIEELKSNGLFFNNDLLYWFGYNSLLTDVEYNSNTNIPNFTAQNIKDFTRLNIVNPLRNELTIGVGLSMGNNPRLTKFGWQNSYNTGATQGVWLSTGWASNQGVNYTQNNARITIGVSQYNDNVAGTFAMSGNGSGGTLSNIFMQWVNGDFRWRLNDNTTTASAVALTTKRGLHSINRSASNAVQWYVNGVSTATKTTASSVVNANILTILTAVGINTFNQPIDYFKVGSSYTASQQLIETQIYNYMRSKLGYQ